jgi:exopolysaccharide production protein ExoQ
MEAFGIVDVLVYGNWEGKVGDKITQSLNLLLIVSSLFLFIWGFRRTRSIGAGGILALALVSFLLLSAVWSIDPQITIRRSILYLFVIIGGVGIANNLRSNEFMDLLGTACFLTAVASIAWLVFSPENALMPESGALRGIFSHKNILGQVMGVGTVTGIHKINVNSRRLLRKIFMLIVFLLVGILAKSATSVITIIYLYCVIGIISLWRKGGLNRIMISFSLVLLVPIAAIAALIPDQILEMVGKDATLTGRTDLWQYVADDIYQRPLLGWGFSSFWSASNPVATEISIQLGWTVPEAHDGLLQMLLDIGAIGTGLFIFVWIRNVKLAFQCLHTQERELAESSLLFFGAVVLIGVSETILMEPFQIVTSVFFILGMMCERAVRVARGRRYTNVPRASRSDIPIIGRQLDSRRRLSGYLEGRHHRPINEP